MVGPWRGYPDRHDDVAVQADVPGGGDDATQIARFEVWAARDAQSLAAVRHAREVHRAFADLREAIGADPLPGPGAEPPTEPDSSPA